MLGYYCAYYRYYHPLEFLTSFLNNAANDDDIKRGTAYANRIGIKVTMPKWGMSRSSYSYDTDKRIIAKGLSSIKYMNSSIAEEMYDIASSMNNKIHRFVDILIALQSTSINTRQLDILIKIDFFSGYGNQRELLYITDMFYNTFKKGEAKKINKAKIAGSPLDNIVRENSDGTMKNGKEAKNYTIKNMKAILYGVEDHIKSLHMDDLDDILKVKNFEDVMGYAGYVSGKQEDRNKLYIMDIYPLVRRKDKKQFGYSFVTKSIGSGIESRFTVVNSVFNKEPVKKGDIIRCFGWRRQGQYFRMTRYQREF